MTDKRDAPMVPCGPCSKDPRWPHVRCTHGHYIEPVASPAVAQAPRKGTGHEEVSSVRKEDDGTLAVLPSVPQGTLSSEREIAVAQAPATDLLIARLKYDLSPRTEEVVRDGRKRSGQCEYCGNEPHHSTNGACDFRYRANAAADDVRAVITTVESMRVISVTGLDELDRWCEERRTAPTVTTLGMVQREIQRLRALAVPSVRQEDQK
jgi:hypothetical protein